MAIKKEEVEHIAKLARIGTSDKEIEALTKDMSAILDWMKELEQADVANIEPTEHITGSENVMREDKAEPCGMREEIVKLFPESKDGYDKVKSVL
jgi:aspartyl-tRNA(Asn)/glutamyl-tRNA(Gln) amidotransferase subunit C